jgi:rod shape-determining protein MreB and related proteins
MNLLKSFPSLEIDVSRSIAINWGSQCFYIWTPKHGFISYSSFVWVDGREQAQALNRAEQNVQKNWKLVPTMKNGYITDFKICIDFLKKVLADCLGRFEIVKPTIWISVNPTAHSSEIEALQHVLTRAGAGKIHFINQNLALAISHKFDFAGQKSQLQVHLGHQLSLASIISPSGFIQEKQYFFGGQNIDNCIRDYVRRVYRLILSDTDVENIKKLLSPKNTQLEIWGRDLVSDRIKSVQIEFSEVWNQTRFQIDELGNLLRIFLHDLPLELVSDVVDNGILLSGGASRYGKVKDYLQVKLGINVFEVEEPDKAIIRGLKEIIKNKHEFLESDFA